MLSPAQWLEIGKNVLGLVRMIPGPKALPWLIIEDNERDAEMLAYYLTRCGQKAEQVHRLDDAWERIYRTKYQAIILDFRFKNGHGLEFYKELRRKLPRMPVIFVTGNPGDIARIQSGHCYTIIDKGTVSASLLEAISDAVAKVNGLNGDVRLADLFFVAWILCVASALLGSLATWFVLKHNLAN